MKNSRVYRTIDDLTDFSLTIGELQKRLISLSQQYGSDALISVDAGANNVSVEISFEAKK